MKPKNLYFSKSSDALEILGWYKEKYWLKEDEEEFGT